jgi:hypothetical protein
MGSIIRNDDPLPQNARQPDISIWTPKRVQFGTEHYRNDSPSGNTMALKSIEVDVLTNAGADLHIEHGRRDELNLSELNLKHCWFKSLGLAKSSFTKGSIQHCRFDDVYLRSGQFKDVNLTGTRFENCNLKHVSFDGCKMDYTTFHNCELDYEALIRAVPKDKPYLQEQFFHALRINAQSVGNSREANRLLLLEMRADRKEQWLIWTDPFRVCNCFRSSEYFRGGFPFEVQLGCLQLRFGQKGSTPLPPSPSPRCTSAAMAKGGRGFGGAG